MFKNIEVNNNDNSNIKKLRNSENNEINNKYLFFFLFYSFVFNMYIGYLENPF